MSRSTYDSGTSTRENQQVIVRSSSAAELTRDESEAQQHYVECAYAVEQWRSSRDSLDAS